jgi:YNFM family putative membrane transporter
MDAFSYRSAVLAVVLANVAVLSSIYVTQPVLPLFARDFRVSAAAADLTVSLSSLGLAGALLVLGPLSDLVGRKPVMIGASAALILPTVGAAFAPSFGVLLLCRILQGACSAGVGSIALAYIIQEFPPARVGSALGWGTLSLVAAAVTGRVLGGSLADLWSWRAMFVGYAGLDVVGVVAMVYLLPNERRFVPSHSLRTVSRSVGKHLSRPALRLANLSGFLVSFSLLAYFAQLSFYLSGEPFRLSSAALGLVYLVYVVGVLAPAAGSLSSRIGRSRVIGGGFVLLSAGFALSLIPSLAIVVAATAIASFGLFAAHTANNAYVGDMATDDRGTATALYMFSYYIGGAMGVTITGAVWDAWGWHGVIASCMASSLAGVLVASSLPTSMPVGDGREVASSR